jgi:hypothetical protein
MFLKASFCKHANSPLRKQIKAEKREETKKGVEV